MLTIARKSLVINIYYAVDSVRRRPLIILYNIRRNDMQKIFNNSKADSKSSNYEHINFPNKQYNIIISKWTAT